MVEVKLCGNLKLTTEEKLELKRIALDAAMQLGDSTNIDTLINNVDKIYSALIKDEEARLCQCEDKK